MKRVACLFLTLATPALACDGMHLALSWFATGGPLAPLLAMVWPVRAALRLPNKTSRRWAIAMAVLGTLGGYALAFQLGSLLLVHSALGYLFGPLAMVSGMLVGRLPSRLLEARLPPEYNAV